MDTFIGIYVFSLLPAANTGNFSQSFFQ